MSSALTQDSVTSPATTKDNIGLWLSDPESLRDFPEEEELGKNGPTSVEQSKSVNPTVSTVLAGSWWQMSHGVVISLTRIQVESVRSQINLGQVAN